MKMRGSKNYSEVTHKASKKGTKERIKAVHDMVGYKKKLHEMVEALIGGDSKAAAAALHEYLQTKTRVILGEMDMEGEEHGMDFGDEHSSEDDLGLEDDHGDEEFDGESHGDDDEECEHCHGEGCEECEHDDEGDDHDDFGDDEGDDHDSLDSLGGHGSRGDDEFSMHESNETKATPTFKGAHNNAAKDLNRKASKGKMPFKSKGKAKLTKPHNNAAPGLDRKVKGDLKFASKGKAKLTHPHNNAAPGLDRKVKGTVKF
jgi:hypothetical protein